MSFLFITAVFFLGLCYILWEIATEESRALTNHFKNEVDNLNLQIRRSNEEIAKAIRRKNELNRTVDEIKSDLPSMKKDLSDLQQFQQFISAFTYGSKEYLLPLPTEILSAQIQERESTLLGIASECEQIDCTVAELQLSIGLNTQQVDALKRKMNSHKW